MSASGTGYTQAELTTLDAADVAADDLVFVLDVSATGAVDPSHPGRGEDGTTRAIRFGALADAVIDAVEASDLTALLDGVYATAGDLADHESAEDPHDQYALLAGRAGGQTISLSDASGGGGTIQSTSHATKGSLYLNGPEVEVRPNGLQRWRVGGAGMIEYSTPAAFPGIIIWTGSTGTENRFQLVNFGTYAGVGFAADEGAAAARTLVVKRGGAGTGSGQVSIGTHTPPAGSKLHVAGAVSLSALADADAPNGSLYYSTDQSKLVWKDATGAVNALY